MSGWTGFHRREVVEYFTRHIYCNVELFGVDAYIRNLKLVAEVMRQALKINCRIISHYNFFSPLPINIFIQFFQIIKYRFATEIWFSLCPINEHFAMYFSLFMARFTKVQNKNN